MKAIEAPKKIYVPTAGDELHYHMACPNNEFQESIEYTRTDAFVEKACEYLMEYEFNDSPTIADRRKRVEEFRKYMKGE